MMNLMCWTSWVQAMRYATGLILILALAGCNRDETRVYHVPKEAPPSSPSETAAAPEAAQPEMNSTAPAATSLPQLKYQVPEGWQENPPSEMRIASFSASGPNGESADISVIPLPIVGRDLELINMWRSQMQLPATSDPNAVKQSEPIAIGTEQGRLFNFASEQPTPGKSRQRLLMGMLTRGTMSWFFKMTGDDAFVTSEKGKFLQFLKSVSFVGNGPEQSTAAPPTQTKGADSIWTVPSGWQSVPPAQFLLAEFSISGGKAKVNVAEFDGEAGGLLANVNRWRGQLGLGALNENDLPSLVQSLNVPDGKATLVDFTGVDTKTGAPARLLGAVVLRNNQSWFYKLMGDKQLVAEQKNTFTKFIQSANYANAR